MNSLLQISTLLSQTVVLSRLHLQFFFNVLHTIALHVILRLQVLKISVLLLCQLLEPVDFHLADIDFILVLLNLNFDLLVGLLLRICDTIELDRHLLNLLSLSMVDIRLSGYVLVALFNLELGTLEFLRHIPFGFLCLGQLDFDVAQRVFQLLVLNLAQPQHLPVFNFSALLSLHTEPSSDNSIILQGKKKVWVNVCLEK